MLYENTACKGSSYCSGALSYIIACSISSKLYIVSTYKPYTYKRIHKIFQLWLYLVTLTLVAKQSNFHVFCYFLIYTLINTTFYFV